MNYHVHSENNKNQRYHIKYQIDKNEKAKDFGRFHG